MPNRKERLIIALMILATVGFATTPNAQAVKFQLAVLCQDNPQHSCEKIVDYCMESLEKGQECYIIN